MFRPLRFSLAGVTVWCSIEVILTSSDYSEGRTVRKVEGVDRMWGRLDMEVRNVNIGWLAKECVCAELRSRSARVTAGLLWEGGSIEYG